MESSARVANFFSASEVAHGKPAPDLFLHAAKQMGVDPSACIVVEDSKYGTPPRNDHTTPTAHGLCGHKP